METRSVETRTPGGERLPAVRPATPLATQLLHGAVTVASLGVVRLRGAPELEAPARRGPRISLYRLSFVVMVVLPALAAWLYFAVVATDQYAAEARFAVRAATLETMGSDPAKKALGAMDTGAMGSTPSLAGQDAYVVTTYIASHAMLSDLAKSIDVRAIYTRPEADFWARLQAHATAEDLLSYWRGMVTATVDGPSGIVTVKVRAFRPADALALAGAITTASETLINAVSARARADSMKHAEEEVRAAEGKVQTALVAVRRFRDRQGYLDPTIQANATGQLLGQLMADRLAVENDLFVAQRAVSAEAPQVKTMQAHLASVTQQIDQLKGEITGHGAAATVAGSLPEFESLELQRTFAEKLYTLAADGLERARQKAEQQNIYVSEFVAPALPQEAEYPRRLSLSIIIPLALAILWAILALLAAAIDDHRY